MVPLNKTPYLFKLILLMGQGRRGRNRSLRRPQRDTGLEMA